MKTTNDDYQTEDQFDLTRFVDAQDADYSRALAEIKSGLKRSHWIWYIFPQIDGLAFSTMSKHYAIKSIEEARAFLEHPVLGPRLRECAEAIINVNGRSIGEILGAPDDLKLRSCATLFSLVSPSGSVFDRVLEKHFQGERDDRTLGVLGTT